MAVSLMTLDKYMVQERSLCIDRASIVLQKPYLTQVFRLSFSILWDMYVFVDIPSDIDLLRNLMLI